MTPTEHKARHQLLHQQLDELVADWIGQTRKLPSNSSVLDLMQWSHAQSENPTDPNLPTEKPEAVVV